MYQYKNLLIPLNLTSTDDAAIQFASQISQISKSRKTHFIHVKRPSEIPQEILDEYPELLNPAVEQRKQKMQEQVDAGFHAHAETDAVYDVKEGKPLEVLLGQIVKNDIDLVVIGRKTDAEETRRLPINLARKAPCSVLVVPQKSEHRISKILVPIDFSDFSANALELALNLASANSISDIQCLHVFQLPLGYHKTGKSKEEFTEIMMRNAKKNYENFMRNVDLKGIDVNPLFMLHDKPIKAIQSVVEKHKIDMLVLGTRGRNAGVGILLGSVTEELILKTKVPLIAVKKKGTGLSFLEVLLKYI